MIRRHEGGEDPNGVLEEVAFFGALLSLVRDLDEDSGRAIFRAGAELSASHGDTTAQEGRASPSTTRMIRQVATKEGIDIDVVVYPDVLMDRDFIARTASADYTDRVRVGGAKLTIDGSPQGFTACRDRPCYRPPSHLRAGYGGDTAASDDQVFDAIDWAFANGIQILTHSNGEGASDILIAAIETATEAHGPGDRRPVLIHGQFLREDQVDAFNRLGVFPSLFPMHPFYWGDWHREHTVGPAAADNISSTGWVRQRGMMFSSHHDAPVAFPDSMRILDATVTRRSRSADIIGPDHRVDVTTALKAMTVWPVYQHFEEDRKGSIAPGKLADLVILSEDPTAVDPETLDRVTVAATVKEGETIYEATTDETRLRYFPARDGHDPFAEMLRRAAVTMEAQGAAPAQRRFARLAAQAPHSGACVAGTFGAALMAGVEG